MHALPLLIALAAAVVGAAVDLRTRRIPNWLTLGTLALGFALQAGFAGASGLAAAALGSVTAGLPALVLFRLRAMGGGDVKLLAGCGALVGPAAGLELLLATAVAGGALAAVALLLGRGWRVTRANLLLLGTHWRTHGPTPCPAVSLGRSSGVTLPYGIAVAAGMLVTFVARLGVGS